MSSGNLLEICLAGFVDTVVRFLSAPVHSDTHAVSWTVWRLAINRCQPMQLPRAVDDQAGRRIYQRINISCPAFAVPCFIISMLHGSNVKMQNH